MSAIYEDQIAIPLLSYSGAGPIESLELAMLGATGLVVVLYVKTAGTTTLAVRLVGKEIFENTYSQQLNVDKTITTASRHVWMFGPGLAPQPPGEAAVTTNTPIVQTVGIAVPERFKLQVAKGDVSAWEFALAYRRTP